MSKPFKPMKGDDAVRDKLVFPYMLSPKIDGYRCVVRDGVALTSTLKPFANDYVRRALSTSILDGLDGELTIGLPTDPGTFRASGALRRKEGAPDFTFHVFDTTRDMELPALSRYANALHQVDIARCSCPLAVLHVVMLECHMVRTMEELLHWEQHYIGLGYEGVMLRQPDGRYKPGRSTVIENLLLKVKGFLDFEAEVIGFIEQMHNTNEQTRDERGLAKRSRVKSGLVGKDTLGAFLVRGVNGPFAGVEFEIATGQGWTEAFRAQVWADRERTLGKVLTYKCQDVGGYDKPRLPIGKAFRDPLEVE